MKSSMKLKSKKRIMTNIMDHAIYLFIRKVILNCINVCVPMKINATCDNVIVFNTNMFIIRAQE